MWQWSGGGSSFYINSSVQVIDSGVGVAQKQQQKEQMETERGKREMLVFL